jgi:hypothetical protein
MYDLNLVHVLKNVGKMPGLMPGIFIVTVLNPRQNS